MNTYICECGKDFPSKESLRAHRWRCKIGKPFLKNEMNQKELIKQSHKVCHSFRCECGKEFKSYPWLARHLRSCDNCSEEFKRNMGLKINVQIFKCDICGNEYDTAQGLQQHKVRKHDALTVSKQRQEEKNKYLNGFNCRFCNKFFDSSHKGKLHESWCSSNPNHRKHNTKPWNKGKTAKTDERIAKSVEIHKRRIKEGLVVSHSHPHSEETKEKIRKARIEYLKKHTGKTAWERRHAGEMSYIEQWFFDNIIQKHRLYEKFHIVNEYSVYPYFLDFAFLNEQIDFELDGTYHLKHKEHDFIRDTKLKALGWIVIRITSDEIKNHPEEIESNVMSFLSEIKKC